MAHSKGLGTTLTIDSVTIGQIVGITPPGVQRGEVEITDLDDTWSDFLPTILRAEPCTLLLNWDPDATVNHDDIWTHLGTGTAYTCKITLPSGPTTDVFTFSAFVSSMVWNEVTVDTTWQVAVTLRVRGSVALAST